LSQKLRKNVTKTVENEKKMNKISTIAWDFGMVVLITGCAAQYQAQEQALQQPINCATAEGDIRVLQSEKSHVAQQATLGITALAPAGIVIGVLTGTEKTKLQVATGEYNQMIDAKIAAIKRTCGV
jgi:hypothetical protein